MRLYTYLSSICILYTLSLSGVALASSSISQEETVQTPPPVENITPADKAPLVQYLGELWTGSLYSSTYKAGLCIDDAGKVHGVLILTLQNGKEDVYHFEGTKDIQGVFRLKHHSGHHFKGSFENATTIQGKVTTKNGFSLHLKGKREQDILLNGPTCRPF